MNFFNIDGPFQRIGSFVFDIMVLGLLWTLISMFGFGITIGAATTSLYAACYVALVKEEGYVFKTFFTTFKQKIFEVNFCMAYTCSFICAHVLQYYLHNKGIT